MRSATWSLLPLTLLASIAEGTHHIVTVGKGSQLKYDPENVVAAAGDTVEYQFFAKKHSVVQSSFTEPCVPSKDGFFSGFTPNDSPDVAAPTIFTITVNDTKPIWFYCSQTNGDHCQKGMVGSINAPPQGNTLEKFKENAAKAPTPSKSPPDLLPVGGVRKLRVDVGLDGKLVFTPNNITELPRTIVEFSFNPKNHTVTQSSFDKPCQPLDKGFSSGFIPTTVSPSGVLFDIVIENDKPIWFYCGQVNGDHCQKGMVGSINAPAQGNTLEEFIKNAAATLGTKSTIPPEAPLLGTITVNGTIIPTFNGNQLPDTTLTKDPSGNPAVPSPGAAVPPQMSGMAGGGQPANYNWAPSMSDDATSFLQLLQYFDDILLHILFKGYDNLNGGSWAGVYPKSIVDTIGSMTAQSLVHRTTATDCLNHYQKPLLGTCSYKLKLDSVDDFLHAVEKLLLLEIGALADVSALLAKSDAWLIPPLVSEVGAKSRMTAVVNMMQNHLAAAAPREVVIPAPLAWSYATQHYVESCPDAIAKMPTKTWPALTATNKVQTPGGGRTTGVTLTWDGSNNNNSDKHWVAWIGPWGGLEFSELGTDGSVAVPASLYGHVWMVVTSKKDVKLQELADVTVAGPEVVWVSQP
ncbi:hypothetical protein B0H66DRAFT_517229 [Apodospora peruviana]|uniref:Cupredoxin n=1 Tax=Apodospora peruviana TaxID=516989 RepID=A0AAE0M5P5_9PEZI|nr:hypothetical protein B0H66DRAFT_517229 [Apodospora peruviana]